MLLRNYDIYNMLEGKISLSTNEHAPFLSSDEMRQAEASLRAAVEDLKEKLKNYNQELNREKNRALRVNWEEINRRIELAATDDQRDRMLKYYEQFIK